MRKRGVFFVLTCLILAPALHQGALSQPVLHSLLINGPTSKRINVVFFSEGYTAGQVSQYLTDATGCLNTLMNTAPFNSYGGYFNAFAVSVASNESGSDHPSRSVYRDTYFNSTYDSQGIARLITIDGTGSTRMYQLLQNLMPEYDLIVMLVNDPEYGGSGGSIAIASVHPSSAEITLHELGHSFGRLADEYESSIPSPPSGGGPNVTQETIRTQIKWRTWILESTPVPTPEISTYNDVVGLFEGAYYRTTGWYRPKLNCMMRSLSMPFCEVCKEELVKSVYGLLRPIESFLPSTVSFSLRDSQTTTLSVLVLDPASHDMRIQWYVDGVHRTTATSPQFVASPRNLGIGPHTVKVVVWDTTTMVRNDPSGRLRDSTSWSILVTSVLPVARVPGGSGEEHSRLGFHRYGRRRETL